MKTVYKYPLCFPPRPQAQVVDVLIPAGAVITLVDYQHGQLCAWAVVDHHAPHAVRTFAKTLTGRPIHPAARQVWTVTPDNFTTMIHITDIGERAL